MGRTGNPHRLFGSAMAAMGAFGLIFLFVAGAILKLSGPGALFYLFLADLLAIFSGNRQILYETNDYPVSRGAATTDTGEKRGDKAG